MRLVITGVITVILIAIIAPLKEKETDYSLRNNRNVTGMTEPILPLKIRPDFRWKDPIPAILLPFFGNDYSGPIDTQTFAKVKN